MVWAEAWGQQHRWDFSPSPVILVNASLEVVTDWLAACSEMLIW